MVIITHCFFFEPLNPFLPPFYHPEYASFLSVIQFANNEIGTIQNIKHLSNIVHKYEGIFHTDAVQVFAEIPIDVNEYGIDIMSVSGHKFRCPKGIGFLYKSNKADIEPLIHGGTQEFGSQAGCKGN